MATRLTTTGYGTLPLKYTVGILPFLILMHFWPRHHSAAWSVGLGLGVIGSNLIPPRPPLRVVLACVAVAVIVGAMAPALGLLR